MDSGLKHKIDRIYLTRVGRIYLSYQDRHNAMFEYFLPGLVRSYVIIFLTKIGKFIHLKQSYQYWQNVDPLVVETSELVEGRMTDLKRLKSHCSSQIASAILSKIVSPVANLTGMQCM